MTNNKPWYKNWWGVIVAILIWPFFLLWLLWRKGSKTNLALKIVGSLGILALVIILAIAVSNPKTNTVPTIVNKSSTTKSKAEAHLTSAQKMQVQAILTADDQHYQTQLNAGQAALAQPGNSFYNWKQSANPTDDVSYINALKQANAIYINANAYEPEDPINNWSSDINNVQSDLATWVQDATSYQINQKTTADLQNDVNTFNSDISKANSDIQSLITGS